MEITTITNDGQTIKYCFDPGHRAGVCAFYAAAVAAGEIAEYRVSE